MSFILGVVVGVIIGALLWYDQLEIRLIGSDRRGYDGIVSEVV